MTDFEDNIISFTCACLCENTLFNKCGKQYDIKCEYVRMVMVKFKQEIEKAVFEITDKFYFDDNEKDEIKRDLKSRGIE